MIEYLVLIIIIIAFTLASLEDIKKREVYDYLNFSLAFIVIAISIFHSLYINSIDPFKYASFGLLLGFAFGAFLFYIGVWGGGDAKFILGFGASSYYLINFIKFDNTYVEQLYNYGLSLMSVFFNFLIETLTNWIILIDIIFFILVIIQFIRIKRKNERKDLLFLLVILGILLLGLYMKYDPLISTIIGFSAFILIFFAREGIFGSVYIVYKKHLSQLKHGDKIDEDIIINHHKIIDDVYDKKGLTKEEIHLINDHVTKHNQNHDINVKISLPYSTLIGLNFVMYLFKIISLDFTNLTILSFMMKFLFFSFLSGGLLAIYIVLYYFIKHYSKINFKFSKIEYSILLILIIIPIILKVLNFKFYIYVLLLIPIYLFVKMALSIENVAFIKNKELKDITLGDWIVQDIVVGSRVIYTADEFKIGVDEYQLKKIKDLSKKHSELQKIKVKDGIAFLPALYIGFILTLLL